MPLDAEPHASLALFDPLVADWFVEAVGQPTAIQTLAWPVIARGEHVLLSAPTGSGKTLTAFLFALERLLLGHWRLGTTRVLYVSPLKALNTDIARNLAQPLAALTARLEDQGADPPAIRIGVRSGDTTPAERAKMIRRPPEILVTTPESLNLLLASQHAPRLFGGLQTVILDEVHAIADGKRGVHLMTGIERLTLLAGEFQRVALSATVSPMSLMAAYVGGATWDGRTHTPRPVTQVAAPGAKQIELTQAQPTARPGLESADRWRVAAEDIRRLILEHRTTLVFVNSRRAAERLTLAVNDGQPEPLAFSHHGSLSRETRQAVERRLKSGDLRAVIATGSLELGIDIGALDLVVMYETPPGVAATLQRVGRAGHGVGEVSRGVLLSPSGRDILLATVMADCVAARELEPLAPPRGPLDVLCQVILGLCARDTWDLGDLYDQIRCAWSYHNLPRPHFDRVIDLLAGRWARPGQPGLDTRLHVDRLAQTATANPKALRHLATQGGTIPDRGYFTLRVQSSGARLGELDEEYVFERSIGDRLVLGTQAWRIEAISANDVLVSPDPRGGPAPFWRAEDNPRETLFATRVAEFLEAAEGWLASGEGGAGIAAATHLSPEAVATLETYLDSQREATRSPLPHRHHLLAEQLDLKQSGGGLQQLVLHTHWGGRLNVPYALALAAACRRAGQPVRTYGNDNGVLLLADVVPSAADVLEWVRPDNLLDLLREQLPHAAVFGARFREAAGTAMVVSRGFPGRRTPLWLTRQRAKELLEATSDQPDFPLALEAWRACLQDQFDLPTLSTRLAELQAGEIDWSTCSTVQPSPFASGLAWTMTGELMYADDAPTSAASLTDQLLADLVFDAELRPALPAAVCDELAAKLARTAPGYAPGTAAELVDLVRDRLWLTAAEWAELLAAVGRDNGLDPAALAAEAAPRLATVQPPGGGALTMALEQVPWLEAVLGHELTDRLGAAERAQLAPLSAELEGLLLAWAAGRGAVALDAFTAALGLPPAQVDEAAAGLAARQALVRDVRVEGEAADRICTPTNLDRLLRAARAARRPSVVARPAADLPLWLARRGGLLPPAADAEALGETLARLAGWSAPLPEWEAALLPARAAGYEPRWIDRLVSEEGFVWVGAEGERVTFAPADLLDLVRPTADAPPEWLPASGRHTLAELGRAPDDPELWAAAWSGAVSADSLQPLRGFAPSREPVQREGRLAPGWWRRKAGAEQHWFRLPPPATAADRLAEVELARDRVRLLLARYGLLARELLRGEPPGLRWAEVFPAARLMELSGELVAGHFFEGLGGPQFTTRAHLPELAAEWPTDPVWWLRATDPASLCGASVQGLDLPDRRATTTLVYHGRHLVLVATASAAELTVTAPPDAPRAGEYFAFLAPLAAAHPQHRVTITTINGEPAPASPYLDALRADHEVVAGPRAVQVWRRTGR